MGQSYRKSWHQLFKNRKVALMIVILLFAGLGVISLLVSHATQNGIGPEAENGSLSGGANRLPNGNTSNGYYVRFSSDANLPTMTALTVLGTDGMVGNALCFDSSVSGSVGCLQAKPDGSNLARYGIYNIGTKSFTASTDWLAFVDVSFGTILHAYNCSSGGRFYGYGPLMNSGKSTYYGEVVGVGVAAYGSLDGATHNCSTGAGGTLASTQWATPLITCSNSSGVIRVSNADQLAQAVTNGADNSEICLEPGGHYMLTSTLLPKLNMKIIGDPFNRTVLDATNIPISGGTTSVFDSMNVSTGATIANLVVINAKTPGETICQNCGYGIVGGENYHLYNLKLANNQLAGFHYFNPAPNSGGFVLENSEVTSNGNAKDFGPSSYTSAGVKTTHAGTFKNNVVMSNIGPGLWCDVGCNGGQWQADNNYVSQNKWTGIYYEMSGNNPGDNALISNNVVIGNNTAKATYYGGIGVQNSQNAEVLNNTLLNNDWGSIVVFQDHRSGYITVKNVSVHDNNLNGIAVYGCSIPDVTCNNNN